jgi:hypothetical protein
MICEEDVLEPILKSQLQKTLEFELGGKVFKRGKFALYRIETYNNNFEITFKFSKPGTPLKVENFKVPYPFHIEYYADDDVIFFDYRLSTLTNNNKDLIRKLEELAQTYETSKYFNKILKITCSV